MENQRKDIKKCRVCGLTQVLDNFLKGNETSRVCHDCDLEMKRNKYWEEKNLEEVYKTKGNYESNI